MGGGTWGLGSGDRSRGQGAGGGKGAVEARVLWGLHPMALKGKGGSTDATHPAPTNSGMNR
jgi:hypothetical protein